MRRLLMTLMCLCIVLMAIAQAVSPNGMLTVKAKGEGLEVSYKKQSVLTIPKIGLSEKGLAGVNKKIK